MSIKKFSLMLLGTMSMAALLNGCGSSSKEGTSPGEVAKVPEAACKVCHAVSVDPLSGRNIVAGFLASPHNRDEVGCQGCHGGGAQHNGVGPIPFPSPTDRCSVCHTGTNTAFGNDADIQAQHANSYLKPASVANPGNCGTCHNPHDPLNAPFIGGSCVACHSFPQDRTDKGTYVNDNNGVRAITVEFTKWSHHVTGVTLNDAHCAACHLEGKVANGKVVVDTTKHMADAKIHLRHADNDSDYQWDPAAPNHSNMDNFCMSCHDANGATSPMSIQIQAFINSNGLAAAGKTASARNPFGDTISNRYDKMQRPGVVNVDNQFDTTNNSHHAVKGPRYSGRTRTAGARQIANPAAFAANSSATLWGKRSTIYDSVNATTGVSELATNPAFNALYVPLANNGGEAAPRTGNASLGDDSTLHCGDCHTVGQWKPGVATNAAGVLNTVAIGAHGSNNEYLLRNSIGTDERHTQDAYEKNTALNTPNPGPAGTVTLKNPNAPFLVCFNCHSYKRYGSVYNATGTTGPHAGEYDASGRCNGVGNTIPFNGYTTGKATDGTQFASRFEGPRSAYSSTPAFAPGFPLNFTKAPGGVQAATYTGEQDPDFGNIFGIQCNNCHNSGIGNAYGGIHGSAKNSPGTANTTLTVDPSVKGGAYVDGMGNTTKVQRFLPGLGNIMHVPGTLGGFTGGTTAGPVTNSTFTYSFTTGGISNDTNWEQVIWTQTPVGGNNVSRAGAGCYTNPGIGTDAQIQAGPAYGIQGPSVTGEGGPSVAAYGTWGGCDDHGAEAGRASATSTGGKGGGHYGFNKRINRPVTY